MHQPPSKPSTSGEQPRESPRHGFQGDRGAPPPVRSGPSTLTIALSREAGARGGSIARRVGRKLGWQVYDQELLEYMAQESIVSQGVLDAPPATPADWVEARVQQLIREGTVLEHPSIVNLTRVILSLGAQGQAVLIGRGAGCLLPRETTLNVRIVAPLHERIAYMGDWLRLTVEEATERVRLRDERRTEFIANNFHRDPGDIHQYDMVLNSSLLGEDVCAELIAQAARARTAQLAH
jgi:hypothetical protein